MFRSLLPLVVLLAMLLFIPGCDVEDDGSGGSGSTLNVTTTTLPDALNGQAYSTQLAATGGSQPYTWTVVSGTLPSGLALDSQTGVISGTPNDQPVEDYVFTVEVADSSAPSQTTQVQLKIFLDQLVFPVDQ